MYENTGMFLVKTFATCSQTVNLREEMLRPESESESLDIFPQFNKQTNKAGRGMRGEECQYKTNNYLEFLK